MQVPLGILYPTLTYAALTAAIQSFCTEVVWTALQPACNGGKVDNWRSSECSSGTPAQLGGHVPNDVYAWVIVFILPIKSAINPFLCTASYIWRRKKRAKVKKNKPKLGKVRKQQEYQETTV